ncbi:molybdate ABC transporter substrate-binding protein [Cellulosimicrobium sp. CUA-896]|uniref:molybdate ABC transporter substrate-binding protein n=1 Tax=Cellulosimicrobium sp. CUA-896 TaxID=1517881 RepID=UPI0009612B25|nr:molybdate ABC transporter substrate-binding protein [Cellulosimicrobium sp. CUA-896]OLT54667.1 molybdate ABC transporter substrate-binding protein [Cellulosimicrobium sp. CUA-896]
MSTAPARPLARRRTPATAPPARRGPRRTAASLTAGALVALTAACGASGADGGAASGSGAEERTLTVLAAASLRDVLTEIAADFEAEHEGVTVALSFAGSSDLADQVLAGAPADVLATADERTMERVVEAGDARDPVVFATNTLTVVTPPDNPAEVTGLADLADDDVRVVVCAPRVPCGAATDAVEDAAGVSLHRVSEEASVTDVLGKVTSGEADAGLVYVTDARLAGQDVAVVDVPEAAAAVNTYPVAVLAAASEAGPDQAELAQEWVDLVTGDAGREALADAGFGAP